MAIIPTYEGTTITGLDLIGANIYPSDTDISKVTIVAYLQELVWLAPGRENLLSGHNCRPWLPPGQK